APAIAAATAAVVAATATAPVAAEAATAAATESTTATTAAGHLRASFIHREPASLHVLLVETLDRRAGAFVGRHLDEREAARLSCRPIAHHAHRLHRASLGEHGLERA